MVERVNLLSPGGAAVTMKGDEEEGWSAHYGTETDC